MAFLINEMARSIVHTVPARPATINIVAIEDFGRDEWEYLWRRVPRGELAQEVRRRLARRVADLLMEKCEPFIQNNLANGVPQFRLEVVLSDRGAYEHWLPQERKQGRNEGIEATKKRLPHGIDLDRLDE